MKVLDPKIGLILKFLVSNSTSHQGGVFGDNWHTFSYSLNENMLCVLNSSTSQKHLCWVPMTYDFMENSEAPLMSTNNILFYEEPEKIVPELSSNTLLTNFSVVW